MEEVPTPELESREQRDLFDIIRTMMAKNAAERFQDAEHLGKVLEGKAPVPAAPLGSAPTVAMRAAPTTMAQAHPQVTSPTTPTTPMPRTDLRPPVRIEQKKKRSGALVGMFFLLLVGGGGAGGWYYYTNFMQPGVALGGKSDSASAAVPVVDSAAIRDSISKTDSIRADSARKLATPAAPLPMTGTLIVTGVPAGGRVSVDGKSFDPTGPINVDPGSHRIVAVARGYENYSTTIAVARGVQMPLSITMTPATRQPAPKGATPATEPPAPTKVAGNTPAAAAGQPQCDSPVGENYNLNNFCWDDRPVPNSAPLVPIGEDIQGNPSPSIVYILVSQEGSVQRVMSKTISNTSAFHGLALAWAKTLTFRPAQKDGQPVKAWVEVMLRPTRSN
jgi:hypothetical protein